MPAPAVHYRHGLALLSHVREAPPFMAYDARLDAWTAPGHRMAELRAWAAERGIASYVPGDDEGGDAPALVDPRVPAGSACSAPVMAERYAARATSGIAEWAHLTPARDGTAPPPLVPFAIRARSLPPA